jgi:transposase-like protein
MTIACPICLNTKKKAAKNERIIRKGSFYRTSDGQHVSRFCCRRCKVHFSSATKNICYRQKKRQKNETIRRLLAGGMSQREIARVLKLNRKTVVRKFLFLAKKEAEVFRKGNLTHAPAIEVEFDDLETFEHSKCKPLSVTLMVEHRTRRILDFEVSQMSAKGRLTQRAYKKYGFRADHRKSGRKRLFSRSQALISPYALVRSDSNPHYLPEVKEFFPKARYETILGGRGAITGQGELKKLSWDPIFSLNHTCAMMRANINRLFRKTWCTTKKKERLAAHIMIYAAKHNRNLSTA